MKFRYLFLFFFITTLYGEPAIPSLQLPPPPNYLYTEVTRRFTDYYNYEWILQTLKEHGMTLEHRNFFEHIIPHEELGFFGYHSSTQRFRVFQDIIRVVIEELCNISIKEDFHFLRVPGNPLLSRQTAQQFLTDYPKVDNNAPEQQEQLLSMNYALFGNFTNFGSCSVYYFTTNYSNIRVNFEEKLRGLFESVGLPHEAIPNLFAMGHPLQEHDAILLQFFDFSHHNPFHQAYQLVDTMSYEALPGGIPNLRHTSQSELYLNDIPHPFTPQFRLVINNAEILNPFSPLVIKRYERNPQDVVEQYEKKLRAAIRALPYDPEKAKGFREHLLHLWGQSDE